MHRFDSDLNDFRTRRIAMFLIRFSLSDSLEVGLWLMQWGETFRCEAIPKLTLSHLNTLPKCEMIRDIFCGIQR